MSAILYTVQSYDEAIISQIAGWYEKEWHLPQARTINRLANHPSDEVLFQLAFMQNDKPIATGGLYNEIGLTVAYPRFQEFRPWVALMYVDEEFRNQGLGSRLLTEIEKQGVDLGFEKLYLHSFSAEDFYLKYGWQPIDSATYKGHTTVVMEKQVQ